MVLTNIIGVRDDGKVQDDGKVWDDGGDWRGLPGNLCEKYAQGIVAAPEAFPGG